MRTYEDVRCWRHEQDCPDTELYMSKVPRFFSQMSRPFHSSRSDLVQKQSGILAPTKVKLTCQPMSVAKHVKILPRRIKLALPQMRMRTLFGDNVINWTKRGADWHVNGAANDSAIYSGRKWPSTRNSRLRSDRNKCVYRKKRSAVGNRDLL